MKLRYLKSITLIFLFILSLFTLTNCSTSDIEDTIDSLTPEIEIPKEEEEEENVLVSFTAKVNGVDFKTSNTLNELGIGEDVTADIIEIIPGSYFISILAFDSQAGLSQVNAINIFMVVKDLNALEEGKTFDTIIVDFTSEEGAFAVYGENVFEDNEDGDEDSQDIDDDENELQEIFVKITGFDLDKKLMSGEFNFKGGNTDIEYNVTEGVFIDIPFELEQ